MKFSTNTDIEAPIDAVFEMFCDFQSFERSAMRRGADVVRLDQMTEPAIGMKWRAGFQMRGKRREVVLEIVNFDRPREIRLEGASQGMHSITQIELIALSRNCTRVHIGLEVKPLNLPARLLVQSLKLAKNSLTRKFRQRVEEYARGMEDRYARRA